MDATGCHRSDRGGARSGTGGLRFAHAAFVKSHLYMALISYAYQLDVNPLLEAGIALDFGRTLPPVWPKFVDKHYEMGIPHRHWNALHFAERSHHTVLTAHFRDAHCRFKFERIFAACNERTSFQPGAGSNGNRLFPGLGTQIRRHAARTVAGNLGVRSVGVDQASFHVSTVGREKPFHSIGTHTVMTIANPASKVGEVPLSCSTLDDEEVVSAGAGFGERNPHVRRAHSCSTTPSEATVEKTV